MRKNVSKWVYLSLWEGHFYHLKSPSVYDHSYRLEILKSVNKGYYIEWMKKGKGRPCIERERGIGLKEEKKTKNERRTDSLQISMIQLCS